MWNPPTNQIPSPGTWFSKPEGLLLRAATPPWNPALPKTRFGSGSAACSTRIRRGSTVSVAVWHCRPRWPFRSPTPFLRRSRIGQSKTPVSPRGAQAARPNPPAAPSTPTASPDQGQIGPHGCPQPASSQVRPAPRLLPDRLDAHEPLAGWNRSVSLPWMGFRREKVSWSLLHHPRYCSCG